MDSQKAVVLVIAKVDPRNVNARGILTRTPELDSLSSHVEFLADTMPGGRRLTVESGFAYITTPSSQNRLFETIGSPSEEVVGMLTAEVPVGVLVFEGKNAHKTIASILGRGDGRGKKGKKDSYRNIHVGPKGKMQYLFVSPDQAKSTALLEFFFTNRRVHRLS
ncbi:MAG: hypothetical protein KC877_03025 [Candidatus Kaiserbacteria bacterium]|nr:hypothetical protein [Candidatus Kaiserbacteria bacterium]MCB9816777.1 hypothetical protein [Candidatus Nomurabacteria bacterium]